MPIFEHEAVTITASALNRRIAIEQSVDTPDGQGGDASRTWQIVPGCQSIPCSVAPANLPKKGDQTWQQNQMYAAHWKEFRIRYRPSTNIVNGMRVRYGAKRFIIRAVDVPGEEQRVILILGEEIQMTGTLHN